MKKILFTLLAAFIISMTACASKTIITDNLTAAQLIQKGQNAFDVADYKTAKAYYENVLMRYGDNTINYIEAKYELGHLYVKTRDYKKAYDALTEIIEIYDYSNYGDLPPSYKKLAEIQMANIPESKLAELKAEDMHNSDM